MVGEEMSLEQLCDSLWVIHLFVYLSIVSFNNIV